MAAPYGLEPSQNCLACRWKTDHSFCDLPKNTLQAFEAIKHGTSYPPGAILFVEGQPAHGIFHLCRGRVKLYMTSSTGKMLLLKVAEPGDVLGLHAVVGGRPFDVTAETLEPSQIAFARREDFLRFLQEHGDACLLAARHLSDGCQSAFDYIRNIGLSHSAAEKLARLLLEWCESGEESGEGIRIRLRLTQEEIAQRIGATRETVNRLFGRFESENLIRVLGSTLLVRDRAALISRLST